MAESLFDFNNETQQGLEDANWKRISERNFGGYTPQSYHEALLMSKYNRRAAANEQLSKGIRGLFGLQTEEEARQSTLKGVLGQAIETLPPEQRNSRASIMNRVSDILATNPNFQKEAFTAKLEAASLFNEEQKNTAELKYKEALTKSQEIDQLVSTKELSLKQLDISGRIARSALDGLASAKDPVVQSKLWENALLALEKNGVSPQEIETLKSIPPNQRKEVLESIKSASVSSSDELKVEIAGLKNQMALDKLDTQNLYKNIELVLKIKDMQGKRAHQEEIERQGRIRIEDDRDWRKTQANTERKTELQIANMPNTEAIKNITTASSRKKTKELLSSGDFSISEKTLPSASAAYEARMIDLLGEKDKEGFPVYSVSQAEELAQDFIKESLTERNWSSRNDYTPKKKSAPVVKKTGSQQIRIDVN